MKMLLNHEKTLELGHTSNEIVLAFEEPLEERRITRLFHLPKTDALALARAIQAEARNIK